MQRFSTRRGMSFLVFVSVVFLLLAGLGGWYVFTFLQMLPSAEEAVVTPPASLDELAAQYPELATILQDPDLDSAYKDFLLAYQQGGVAEATRLARSRGLINDDNELRITLELDTEDSAKLVTQLEAQGVQVTAVSGNLIDIAVPLQLIEQAMLAGDPGALFRSITELPHVQHIRLPRITIRDVGDVEIESLKVIHADAWQSAGFTGLGVKIGILDMGFNNYRFFLGGDLPADVTTRSFVSGCDVDETQTEHGTAVAEIIHDIAPDAQLFFATYETDVEQRQAVDWLVEQGVNIISHSAGSIYGPMDGSGPEARMVDEVAAQGILWVNSAGNMGEMHYRGQFVDEDGDGFHEFRPGDELMGFVPDGRVSMALNWDAWDTGDQDYDLVILDEEMNEIAISRNIQNDIGDEAGEFITYLFFEQQRYYVAFQARQITRPGEFDFYIYGADVLEYVSPEYSITTPGDALGALAVAATYWSDDELEKYSSQGPSHDGRLKPDISAPAGVQSAVYGDEFFGTSAAAPHVAGAAALVWQAFPTFSAQEVKEYLMNTAKDLGKKGPDTAYGFGRLWLGDLPGVSPADAPTLTPQQGPVDTQPPLESTQAFTPELSTPDVPTPELPTETSEVQPSPTRRTPSTSPPPTKTPGGASGVSNKDDLLFPMFLLCCFAGLGFLGLAGLSIVAWIWAGARRRPAPARPPARPGPSPAVQRTPTPVPAPPARLAPPPVQHPEPPPTSQLVCPRCDTPHAPESRFCRACGLKLEAALPSSPASQVPRYCVHCGQFLRSSSKFCPRCGKPR